MMLKSWNKEVVLDIVRTKFSEYTFVVASNRQPYINRLVKGKVQTSRGPGGVITALDPIMQELKGVWVCCSSGDADRVVSRQGRMTVPLHNPSYEVKFIFLSKEENVGYYYGYSNEGLWPLCHNVFVKPIFRNKDWQMYNKVNKKFAYEIYKEIKNKKAVVFVQDYHLALVSSYLKELKPDCLTILFWHIPWPVYDIFCILPQKQEFLKGMLSYDLVGFHIPHFVDNFMDTVSKELEVKVNRENMSLEHQGRRCWVRSFPISVDFVKVDKIAHEKEVEDILNSLKEEFHLKQKKYKVIGGLDRIDYTKGIYERLIAVDKLLTLYPSLKGKFIFIQMGEISRLHLPQYKQLNDQINALVEDINFKHARGVWKPIIFIRRHLEHKELLAFYRLTDICVVSSLHDGMNLVAKEFISSRFDEQGVLILSKFTGASRQLKQSLLINPYSPEEVAQAIYQALHMDKDEQRVRMRSLRGVVRRDNIWKWLGKILLNIGRE